MRVDVSEEGPVRVVFWGAPVSAKNRMQRTRYGVRKSQRAQDWHDAAVLGLRLAWRGAPMMGDINCCVWSICQRKGPLPDADNLYCAPQDALEAAGVLENDRQIMAHDGSWRRKAHPGEEPRVIVTLTGWAGRAEDQ